MFSDNDFNERHFDYYLKKYIYFKGFKSHFNSCGLKLKMTSYKCIYKYIDR